MTTLDAFELTELAGRDHAEPLDVAVLVHEGEPEPREELAQLREHTGAPVVLATTVPSSGLVRWALDAGIADVLPLPAGRESVLFVIEKAAADRPPGASSAATVVSSPSSRRKAAPGSRSSRPTSRSRQRRTRTRRRC